MYESELYERKRSQKAKRDLKRQAKKNLGWLLLAFACMTFLGIFACGKKKQETPMETELGVKVQTVESYQGSEAGADEMLSGDELTAAAETQAYNNTVLPVGADVKKDGYTVVLDPGHGGKDPGCMAGGVNEKDVNLAIVKKIRTYLEEKGCTVVLTREGDEYPTLSDRVDTANACYADVFVSIHQNALEKDTVTNGIETYCEKTANPGSAKLAQSIQKAVIEATGAKDRGAITSSDLYVVRHNTMPSCLVETGFLTSSKERALLLDDTYQDKIARAVADAVWDFLEAPADTL